MTSLLDVMFMCPTKNVPVRSVWKPMTRAEFENWKDQHRTARAVDCQACEETHRLIAEDYFLEGDRPPA